MNKTLAELREENGMTQRKLAEKLNISPGTIGMYETGKRNPPLDRAIKIAKIFDVPVENISFSNNARHFSDKKERKELISDFRDSWM